MLIDLQNDFVNQGGALFVPGAPEDRDRLVKFIYKFGGRIDQIALSLDTHVDIHIHAPTWWVYKHTKKQVKPLTRVTLNPYGQFVTGDEIEVEPLFQPEWSAAYIKKLEALGGQLVIWPPHCRRNTKGWLLDDQVAAAVAWHEVLKNYQSIQVQKGLEAETEHYSIFRPDVPPPGVTLDSVTNWAFLNFIEEYLLAVAGQALSHCVLKTLEDLVVLCPHIRIVVLLDCCSIIPGFEVQTWRRLHALVQKGVTLYKSTDEFWNHI
jgi:nicotinamidase-related amidase